MTSLQDHPISRQWPPQHRERLQLYTAPTPNGLKVSVMLEETAIAYEAHTIDLGNHEQRLPAFAALNPNHKIPAIWDPMGPGGEPLALFESGAILMYLAEKSGQLLPIDATQRYETLQWVMWQMAGLGPMCGQLGFFYCYGGKDYEDKRPLMRYVGEVQRLLHVLDARLDTRQWIMGRDYTIADIAVLPWVRALSAHYRADALLELPRFANVQRVLQAWLDRPPVQQALQLAVPA